MEPGLHTAILATLLAAAIALVRIPRTLLEEAAERRLSLAGELGLGVVLAAAGVALVETGLGGPPAVRLVAALVLMTLIAVAYADFRFLVVPDLYVAALAAAAFARAQLAGLPQALLGAAVCGGLLWVVAWAWRRTRAVEGLGFGDVKLAAALGALAGAETGLWIIVAGSVLAAAWALASRLATPRRSGDEPPLIPLGAGLAIAGGGLLLWSAR